MQDNNFHKIQNLRNKEYISNHTSNFIAVTHPEIC